MKSSTSVSRAEDVCRRLRLRGAADERSPRPGGGAGRYTPPLSLGPHGPVCQRLLCICLPLGRPSGAVNSSGPQEAASESRLAVRSVPRSPVTLFVRPGGESPLAVCRLHSGLTCPSPSAGCPPASPQLPLRSTFTTIGGGGGGSGEGGGASGQRVPASPIVSPPAPVNLKPSVLWPSARWAGRWEADTSRGGGTRLLDGVPCSTDPPKVISRRIWADLRERGRLGTPVETQEEARARSPESGRNLKRG